MQIDLSRFRSVRVDPEARRAYAAGGSLLGELDHEAMGLGLVTTAGTVSHTGIGGLTLGGGFGRLARRFGLALDNVKAADIVTADGRLLHASADENPDLYWGVRGGGGNFGIVTDFEFGLHPMQRQIVGGEIVFPIDRAREIVEFYGDYSSRAPDDLYADYFMTHADGREARRLRRQRLLFRGCGAGRPGAGAIAQARQSDCGRHQGPGIRRDPAQLGPQRSAQ